MDNILEGRIVDAVTLARWPENPCTRAVREFHMAFGHPVATKLGVPEDYDLRVLRVKLLAEEVAEFAKASGVGVYFEVHSATGQVEIHNTKRNLGSGVAPISIVEAADALGDIEYVLHGAALCYGVPMQACFDEIHASNMAKLGPDGRPIKREDGKILKPEGWCKPDLFKVLSNMSDGS